MEDEILEINPVNSTEIDKVIKVIGVGGGGGHAVNHMFNEGIHNVSFAVCNADVQDLNSSPVPVKIQIGENLTSGLGCGAKPEKGRQAAEESEQKIKELLRDGTKMVFITAGMGGGTGTGAAPVIAKIAKDMGILTVGIVTIPFKFEMGSRIKKALEGVVEMQKNVDALLIINNQRLIELYTDMTLKQAFYKADEVLSESAKSIAEMITKQGDIMNVDFADVETILRQSGVAIMNTGVAEGPNRITNAINEALCSPLLKNKDIRQATRILMYIYTSKENDITIPEMDQINAFVDGINKDLDEELIWGGTYDDKLEGAAKVTLIATGFNIEDLSEITDTEKIKERYYGNSKSEEQPMAAQTPAVESSPAAEYVPAAEQQPAPEPETEVIDFGAWSNEDDFSSINIPPSKR